VVIRGGAPEPIPSMEVWWFVFADKKFIDTGMWHLTATKTLVLSGDLSVFGRG